MHQTPADVAETIVRLREQLSSEGHDCGRRRSPTTSRPSRGALPATHFRVRQDKVDEGGGRVTLHHLSKLHHIGIGRAHKGRPIKPLITDENIRIIDPEDGQLIRELTLDPKRDYQPIGQA